jgi:hypothetical protein
MKRLTPVTLIALFLVVSAVRADLIIPPRPRDPAPPTSPAPPSRPPGSLTDGNSFDVVTTIVTGVSLTLTLAFAGVWLGRRIASRGRPVREPAPFSVTGRPIVKDKLTQAVETAETN